MPLKAIRPGRWRRWELWPIAVWLVMFIGILYAPLPLYSGAFNNDPDNYMRADQVRDFITGPDRHGWYDTTQRRLDPPANGKNGTDVYSRLVDLPLAGVAWLAKSFVGVTNGILIAAFIVPFFLQLPLLLWLLGWAYRPLLGQASWLLAVVSLAYPGLDWEFLPGRIDHHSYQIMLTILSLGAMVRLWMADSDTSPRDIGRCGIILGLALAFSLTIGVEAVPWLGVMLAIVGYRCWQSPMRQRPAAIAFAATAPLAAAVLLLLFRTPAQFTQPTLYVMSLVSVKIALAAGMLALLAAIVAPRIADNKSRALVLLVIAAALGGLLLFDTPGLLHGPWLGFDPWLVSFTKLRASEMRPMILEAGLWPWVEGLGFVALGGYWYGLRETRPERRQMLIILMLLSGVLALATLFYAIRLDRFWFIFSLPGLLYALAFAKTQLRWLMERQPRLAVLLALGLAMAPLAIMALNNAGSQPAAPDNAAVSDFADCDVCLASDYLNVAYPSQRRIMTYGSIGPELVWRTPHIIIGGGIYNNAEGLRAARTFFVQTDPKAAARIMRDWHIDLLYIRNLPEVARVLAVQTDDPYDRPLHANNPNAMIQRLNRGEHLPWLRKRDVPLNAGDKVAVYEVDQVALAEATR